MERTLVLIKPGAVQRGLIGEIISRFEKKGLKIVGAKMMNLNDELLDIHYAHLAGKPFFDNLKKFMKTSPVLALCLEGFEAINVVRKLCGSTNSREAETGTIRGDLGMSKSANLIHSSDSHESAAIEVKRFFYPNELFDYTSVLNNFLYSQSELGQ